MSISVTQPISDAIHRTAAILFKPFDLGKWMVLGFCAFLAYIADFGYQFHFDGTAFFPSGGRPGPGPTPGQWILDNLSWLLPLVLVGLLLGFAIYAVLVWVQSRGKFLFIAAVADNHAAVVEPWKRYRMQGNSLFRFHLLVLVIYALFLLALTGVSLWLIWPDLMAGTLSGHGVIAIVMMTLGGALSYLVYMLVGAVLEDFVVPSMFINDLAIGPAWRLLMDEVFAGYMGTVVLFYLMRMLLGVAFVLAVFLAMCLTCCLAALPYIGTVILLPLIVFFRCYSLCFLEQFGPAWRIFRFDTHPQGVCPGCGYDLRGNPQTSACPECGCVLVVESDTVAQG